MHQKHAKLKRPALGQFHRNEWAFIGTTCGNIQQITKQVCAGLSGKHQLAYVDASHKKPEITDDALNNGALIEYTDKNSYHQLNKVASVGLHQYRQWFNAADGVLVNGNHFKANKQLVFLDSRKKESLSRKLDRLTDVQLFVSVDGVEVFDFLKEQIPNFDQIPVVAFSDEEKIIDFIDASLLAKQAPLYGLVLTGGKSQRMGSDKGSIDYHGKPQREHMADLLEVHCDKVFISCRTEQAETLETSRPFLTDSFEGLGPQGAILSAFRAEPDAAWLVVACDLPLLDEPTIAQLVANRHLSKIATAFFNPATGFAEPLITIWEPRSYPVALQFLAQGYSCPRKILINSDVHLLQLANPAVLANVNTEEEKREILKKL